MIPQSHTAESRVLPRAAAAVVMMVMMAVLAGCSPAKTTTSSGTETAPTLTGKTNAAVTTGPGLVQSETNSFFDDKLKNARDPFFPASARNKPLPPQSSPVQKTVDAAKPPPEVNLVLQGVVGGQGVRIALINNKTFEIGEEAMIRTTNARARVKCVEIGPQSATVTINGKEARKLFLK